MSLSKALPNATVNEIVEKYSAAWALSHSMAVMGWDLETHMPEAGVKARGMATGQLAMMVQKATLALQPLVTKAQKQKNLSDRERGIVRVLGRSLDYYVKIPPRIVNELEKATAQSNLAWRKARKASDFKIFGPHLERVINLKLEVAEKLGYKGHPYNALLDLYEEGFTVADADRIYKRLIPESKKIIQKVSEAGQYPSKHPLESTKYDIRAMEKVNDGIIQILKMPRERFRMDLSTHPFTIGISADDVRITTRYEGTDFKSTMFSTIHESGHAIYNLGFAEDLRFTPAAEGASFGIHESQSRFWENAVGRSREFVEFIEPLLRKNLKFLAKYDSESLYYYFNTVRKSFIRVEADELTYNLHTALRYEIEKKILAEQVKVSELPEVWNDTFDEYFGIEPPDDARGVLQDVHWSWGSFGYFATYTLGNVVLGMIWHKLGDGEAITDAIQGGDPAELKVWLGKNIHQCGSVYAPKELQQKVFGEAYNPQRLLDYYRSKFLA